MTNATSKDVLIRDFGKCLAERNGVLFLGAGLSVPAGYVNWKGLLKEVGDDLGLDLDLESDLLSVAQFHQNHAGNRGKLNQLLLDEFMKVVKPTVNHQLIATLPVETIWTTNYDTLIEDSIRKVGRRPDVKHSKAQLSGRIRGADVTIFKMHGDISMPNETVLTRDDYEEYGKERILFTEKLQGDLISQTFLFLGFSFTDPNIDQILSRVRILLGRGVRNHFCVMKRPDVPVDNTGAHKAQHEYDTRKLELRMQDLKRYGIQTVLIDEYDEVTAILEALNKASHSHEVFVSGSAHDYSPLGQSRIEDLCKKLGYTLIQKDFNLVNGFGLGIGSFIAMSSLEAVYGKEGERIESRVLLRPFPQSVPDTMTRAEVWTRYRQDMISQSGHAIFISGNKLDPASSKVTTANGVHEEFQIAKALGKSLIPIGATGWAALDLWKEVVANLDQHFAGIDVKSEFDIIGKDSSTNDQIVEAIFSIITKNKRK